jgi:hypothetical protein
MVSPSKFLIALFPDLRWNGIGIIEDFGNSRTRPHYGRGSAKVVRFIGFGGHSANPNIIGDRAPVDAATVAGRRLRGVIIDQVAIRDRERNLR